MWTHASAPCVCAHLQVDIEGAEHDLIKVMQQRGVLSLIDRFAFECHGGHAPTNNCSATVETLKAHARTHQSLSSAVGKSAGRLASTAELSALSLGAGEWLRPICEAHGCKASKNASSGAVRGSDARADFWMKRLSEWKAGVGKSARCAAFNLTVEGRRVRLRTTEGATRPK